MFESLGMSSEQYDTGLQGGVPAGLSEEEEMAYTLGRTFTNLRGPLSNEVWDEACKKMGKQQALGVVHIVAGYVYVCMLVNVNGNDD
jgi:4-carboxymuconolactone decarboxylase